MINILLKKETHKDFMSKEINEQDVTAKNLY